VIHSICTFWPWVCMSWIWNQDNEMDAMANILDIVRRKHVYQRINSGSLQVSEQQHSVFSIARILLSSIGSLHIAMTCVIDKKTIAPVRHAKNACVDFSNHAIAAPIIQRLTRTLMRVCKRAYLNTSIDCTNGSPFWPSENIVGGSRAMGGT
jgi:hypothetical protein